MKKSVIKRRKRVVPALQDQSPNGQQPSQLAPSTSPDPSNYTENIDSYTTNADGSVNLGFRTQGRQSIVDQLTFSSSQDRPARYHPPAVDFTGYQSQHNRQSNGTSIPPMNYPSPTPRQPSVSPNPNGPTARKRSLSVAEGEAQDGLDSTKSNRPNSIRSILNPSQQTSEDMPIEPSLLAMSRQNAPETSPGAEHSEKKKNGEAGGAAARGGPDPGNARGQGEGAGRSRQRGRRLMAEARLTVYMRKTFSFTGGRTDHAAVVGGLLSGSSVSRR